MKRVKVSKLVIAFPTTTAAMTMEDICGQGRGRLIPIPREISGSCGLAWCAEPEQEAVLLSLMEEYQIPYQEKRVLALYE